MTEDRAKELGWKRAVGRNDDWFEKHGGYGVFYGAYLANIPDPDKRSIIDNA